MEQVTTGKVLVKHDEGGFHNIAAGHRWGVSACGGTQNRTGWSSEQSSSALLRAETSGDLSSPDRSVTL